MKWSNCRSPLWNRGHQEQQIEEVANSLHHCSKTLNPTESCMHSFLLQHRFKNLPEDHQDNGTFSKTQKEGGISATSLWSKESKPLSDGIPSAFCNPNPSLVGDVAASEGGISGKDHNKQGSPRTCVVMTCRFAINGLRSSAQLWGSAAAYVEEESEMKWLK